MVGRWRTPLRLLVMEKCVIRVFRTLATNSLRLLKTRMVRWRRRTKIVLSLVLLLPSIRGVIFRRRMMVRNTRSRCTNRTLRRRTVVCSPVLELRLCVVFRGNLGVARCVLVILPRLNVVGNYRTSRLLLLGSITLRWILLRAIMVFGTRKTRLWGNVPSRRFLGGNGRCVLVVLCVWKAPKIFRVFRVFMRKLVVGP